MFVQNVKKLHADFFSLLRALIQLLLLSFAPPPALTRSFLSVRLQFGRLNNNDKYKISYSLGNISTTAMNKQHKRFCVCVFLISCSPFRFPLSLCIFSFPFSEFTTQVRYFSAFAIVKSSYFLFFQFFYFSLSLFSIVVVCFEQFLRWPDNSFYVDKRRKKVKKIG